MLPTMSCKPVSSVKARNPVSHAPGKTLLVTGLANILDSQTSHGRHDHVTRDGDGDSGGDARATKNILGNIHHMHPHAHHAAHHRREHKAAGSGKQ